MKKLILFFGIIVPRYISACMPPSPSEIMIGRISSMSQSASGYVDIAFSSFEFPFNEFAYEKPTSWHWQSYSDTSYPWFWTGELIIALSDYQDGSYPTKYSIYHITTLSCEENIIQLGKKYWTTMWWNRKTNDCSHYEAKSLLDVFIEGDETVWLKKLQDKYQTCDTLRNTFPEIMYQQSIQESSQSTVLDSYIDEQTWLEKVIVYLRDIFSWLSF